MKRLELMPTDENILTSLKENIFERNQDLMYFIQLLDSIEGPYSIALNGSWGSGKTFFVKQAKMVLDAYNKDFDMPEMNRLMIKGLIKLPKQEIKNQYCIYYDAWKNDCDMDPIYSLICSITAGYEYFNKRGIGDKKIIADLGFDIIKSIIHFIPNSAVRMILSILPLDKIKEVLKNTNPLSSVKEQIELEGKIQEFLRNLRAEKEERIIIFVDELDRCRPDFAVQLLERIKHYFDLENITFVFSVNSEQLVHTIKKFYGEDFDAGRYLGRFFDQVIPLPQAELPNYFTKLNIGSSVFFDLTIQKFIQTKNLSLRDIVRIANIENIIKKHMTNRDIWFIGSNQDTGYFISYCVIPLLIGINTLEPQNYSTFVNGENVAEFIAFMRENDYSVRIQEALKDRQNDEIIERDESLEGGLRAIYIALFNKSYENENVYVGKYLFTPSIRQYIKEASSLLSQYSNFSY
jgi:hypothetical protein